MNEVSGEDRFDVVVVGGGQAGLAIGYFLRERSRRFVVLERGRVGETWRSQRWDSFAVNTPNWMSSLPGAPCEGPELDGFSTREEWVAYLESYATRFRIPVRTGMTVTSVRPHSERDGFVVSLLGEGGLPLSLETRAVVVASGVMNVPKIPPLSKDLPEGLLQIHTAGYRSPQALPEGSVLVVGAAQSGCQIAEDLLGASRTVYLSSSRVGRIPRRYRGRDTLEWWLDMGFWDVEVDDLEDPAIRSAPQPLVSGVGRYGHTVSLQQLARDGVTLMGRLNGVDGDVLITDDRLAEYAGFADERSERFKSDIDAYISANGVEAPPPDYDVADQPLNGQALSGGIDRLDLNEAGLGTVIWCTGFGSDFDWLHLPVLDESGHPIHRRGVSPVPGVFFLGCPWLHKRKSGVILGLEEDAVFIASSIEDHLG